MKTISKTLKASSVAAAVIVAGIPPLAQGQEARGTLHITGNVVCAPCSLEEIRPTQSDQGQLYQTDHTRTRSSSGAYSLGQRFSDVALFGLAFRNPGAGAG